MSAFFLQITSFTYSGSLGAEHFYGSIRWHDKSDPHRAKEIELEHPLTHRESKYLNKKDGISGRSLYKPGMLSDKFETTKELIRFALKEFNKIRKEDDILFLGSSSNRSAMPILAWPKKLSRKVKYLNKLAEEWDKSEHDEDRCQEIDDEWYNLLKEYFES